MSIKPGFHTYGIDWYTDRIEFFVDEQVYHIHYFNDGAAFAKDGQDQNNIQMIENKRIGVSEYSNHFAEWHPFERKMYIILSAGVGGQNHTYGGPIVPEAIFPCSVFVDWVRVYELQGVNGISGQKDDMGMRIYPNPAGSTIDVQLPSPQNCTLRILNISGKEVYQQLMTQSATVDISTLDSGVYIVYLSDGKMSVSQRMVKQ